MLGRTGTAARDQVARSDRRRAGRVQAGFAVLLLVVAALAGGCGSGAFTGTSDEVPTTSRTSATLPETTTTSSPAANEAVYGYHLPYGDTPNGQDDAVVYMHLLAGRCEEAQAYLDQTWDQLYQYYGGPRAVVLFQTAIEMCRDDREPARHYLDIAAEFGWAGLATDEFSCNIYRATTSALEQVPQESVPCPGGDIPWWPGDSTCDDPRTEADECLTSPGPGSTEPESTEPESTEPDSTELDSTEPDSTEPPVPDSFVTPAAPADEQAAS